MAYKKSAYRKTKDGYVPIHRDFFCKMDKVDQQIYRDTNKPFYLEPSDDGPRLTYNIPNRTFSFWPNFKGNYYGNNEESATHKYCIEEIAKLNFLKIDIGDKKNENIIEFTFNYIFPEIVLQVGENWIKPDLLIYLRKPYDLALKWNRILAIEIVVSHDINGEKLKIMKDAKIPILKIKANKKWGREKEKNMSKEKKEELRNWIKNSFKKGYSAELLLDSKSKAYLENKVINDLEYENEKLSQELKGEKDAILELKEKIETLENDIDKTKNSNVILKKKLSDKDERLDGIKSKNKTLTDYNLKISKQFNTLIKFTIFILLLSSLIIYLR